VTIFDMTGLLTGVMGLGLAALGVLLTFLAGVRLLFLIRRPGKGRIARGIAMAGLVLILCGAALLAGEELDVLRHVTDRAAWMLSALSLLLALFAGIRGGRRRRDAVSGSAAPPERPAADEAEPRQPART
jgi:hypothetical protein